MMIPERENIQFNVLRNALYHTARRRAFERINKLFNLAVVVLGTAVAGDILVGFGVNSIWVGAAVVFVGASQLVFDFARQARDHQLLQRDYFHLLADIAEKPSADEALRASWHGQMLRISGEEPPVMRAVDARAYNDAIGALAWDDGELLVIPRFHRVLGHLWGFEGHHYEKRLERREKLARDRDGRLGHRRA